MAEDRSDELARKTFLITLLGCLGFALFSFLFVIL